MNRPSIHISLLLLVFVGHAAGNFANSQTIIFIDQSATGLNDGTSWTDAFVSLQDAITTTSAGDEIWVAAGIYHPDEGAGITPGDQTVSFRLDKGLKLYGGFSGSETSREERDWEQNDTILSGDLLENDNNNVTFDEPTRSDNSLHVVKMFEQVSAAVMDGFTISGGSGGSSGGGIDGSTAGILENLIISDNVSKFGGGIYSGPLPGWRTRIVNVVFKNNEASKNGGGIFVNNGGDLLFDHVVFRNNRAASIGGGVYSVQGLFLMNRILRFRNVVFIGNAAGEGGGLRNKGGRLIIMNTSFIGNTAGTEGALDVASSFLTIANSLFVGNTATGISGGMSMIESSAEIINSIIAFNTSGTTAGGIWHEGFLEKCSPCTLSIRNSIIWGNRADVSGDQIFQTLGNDTQAPTRVSNSIVEGALGNGVIDDGNVFSLDPLFVDPDGEDNISFTADDNYRLEASSPAIDAGDNTALPPDSLDLDEDGDLDVPIPMDLDGNVRVFDGGSGAATVDLGPYEFGAPPLIVTVEEPGIPTSTGLTLERPFPNPFSAEATLTFSSQKGARTTLTVYDMLGRRVRVLFDGILPPGQPREITFNGKDLAPGAYLIRLQKGSRSVSQMILRGR